MRTKARQDEYMSGLITCQATQRTKHNAVRNCLMANSYHVSQTCLLSLFHKINVILFSRRALVLKSLRSAKNNGGAYSKSYRL